MVDYASKLSKSSVFNHMSVDSPHPLPGIYKRRYIEAFTGAYTGSGTLSQNQDQVRQQRQPDQGYQQIQPKLPSNPQANIHSRSHPLPYSSRVEPESIEVPVISPSFEWLKQVSVSAASGASIGIQVLAVGLYSLAKQLLTTEFTAQEDEITDTAIGTESEPQLESESARKKRKLEMCEIIDLTSDEGIMEEELEVEVLSTIPNSVPGSLPLPPPQQQLSNNFYSNGLLKPAYERSPRATSISANRQRELLNAQITSTEVIPRSHNLTASTSKSASQDPLTSSSLLRSTLAKAAASAENFESKVSKSSNEPLPQHNSFNFPITTKSSGGLFTPTTVRERPLASEISDNILRTPSIAPSSLSSPSTNNHINSPLNSAQKLFHNIKKPLFQDLKNQPSDAIPNSPVIPEVTYGTAFFLNNLSQKKSRPTINANNRTDPMLPYRSNNDGESYEQFAKRLRDAFRGTYYQEPVTSLPEQPSSVPPINPIQPSPLTPLAKVSYKDPRYLLKLHKKRQLLTKKISTSTSTTGITTGITTTISLPSTSELSLEKAKKYSQIHETTERIHEEIEKLKLTEDDEFKKPLDPKHLKLIEDYWYNYTKFRDHDIVGTAFRVDLEVKDVRSLADGSWLNDNVIDFYLSMATEKANKNTNLKSFAFSTHFYSKLDSSQGYKAVSRWAKRKNIDVTILDFVFVPINLSNVHWCLAVVNNRDKKFQFYDSMGGNGSRSLTVLCDYMISEADRINPGHHQEHVAKYTSYSKLSKCPCPQQTNGYDCGVFTCKNVEFLSMGRSLTYLQADIKLIRRNMAHELIHRALNSKL